MSEDPLLTALGRVAAEQGREREAWEKSAAPVADASIDRLTGLVLAQRDGEAVKAATVTPIRRRRLAWAGVAALPLAAAAAFALIATHADHLPSYTLSVSGGVREERGADTRAAAEPIDVAPRSQIVLLARPDARVDGEVHTATFVTCSGATLPVASTSEASDKGALRVTVQGDDLTKAGHGLCDLVLVVSRSSDSIRLTVPVRIAEASH